MTDLDYIKQFSKISVTDICRELSINRGNLLNGLSTQKNAKKVRKNIESKIAELYINSKEV